MSDGTRPHPKSRTMIGPGMRLVHALPRRRRLRRRRRSATPTALAADLRDGYVTPNARARLQGGLSAWQRTARIGVDVGGTFTDFVLHDPKRDLVHTGKLLTTPDDPSRAIVEGTRAHAPRSRPRRPRTCTASSTARRWSPTPSSSAPARKVGLLTTAGFRDSLEIGKEIRYDLYDLFLEPPPTLVPRHLPPRDPRAPELRGRAAAAARRSGRAREARDLVEAQGVEAWPSPSCIPTATPRHERARRRDHPRAAIPTCR